VERGDIEFTCSRVENLVVNFHERSLWKELFQLLSPPLLIHYWEGEEFTSLVNLKGARYVQSISTFSFQICLSAEKA
jgi:hypothetical protein